ncbi:MAG: hypothetical protein N3E50_05740, partial [Candidatus Goldbacteria bacterium]|nr:hypothetical protein [Candidatus Goldiibacteriota bacterium]
VLLLFSFLFFPSIYYLFYYIFKHFYSVIIVGPLLVNKLLNGFYMTFSLMILLSSIAASISVLYLSRETEFLFSTPVRIETVFIFKIYKILNSAGWMIIAIAFPVFFAYKKVLKIDFYQYFFIIFSHIPYCMILTSLGVILTLLLVYFFPAEKVRNFSIGILGIFMAFVIIYFRTLQPEKLTAASFEQMGEFIKALSAPEFILFPHVQFVNIVREITVKGVLLGLPSFLIYFSIALLCFLITLFFAKKFYFLSYGKKDYYKKEKTKTLDLNYRRKNFFINQLIKDLKWSLRDTTRWMQIVFLGGLIAIYLFNLYKLPEELYNLRQMIYYLNIFFIGLILSAISARLILPSISIEGRSFWIYKAAPVSLSKYIFYKLFEYGIFIFLLGTFITFISIKILKPENFVVFLTVFTISAITIVISCMGVGFSGYFADFNIKNQEDILTGVPGIVYMFVSIFFILLIFLLESDIIKMYYISQLVKTKIFEIKRYTINFILIFFISFLFSVLPIWAGIKRLKEIEI